MYFCQYTILLTNSVMPNLRSQYLAYPLRHRRITDLAQLLHQLFLFLRRFYTDCRIKDAPGDVRGARIALCLAAKTVIANVLDIIGVEAPDRM